MTTTENGTATPAPPRLPDNFRAVGRYVVPSLGITVGFTWNATAGNMAMIAGSEGDPVHFTNVIQDGKLYTLTYAFPDIPRNPCSPMGAFSLADLNDHLTHASYVGAEILAGSPDRRVHHFRACAAVAPPPGLLPPIPGLPILRLPLMVGDIYVDAEDPTTWWRVLHFGLQNAYAPDLDEWILLDEFEHAPGEVSLPEECQA